MANEQNEFDLMAASMLMKFVVAETLPGMRALAAFEDCKCPDARCSLNQIRDAARVFVSTLRDIAYAGEKPPAEAVSLDEVVSRLRDAAKGPTP